MTQSLTITYDLHPPPQSTPLSPSQKFEFPIHTKGEGWKSYYDSLRVSIGEAKMVIGAELTAWRDAVEPLSLKGSKKNAEDAEEDVEEGEEE